MQWRFAQRVRPPQFRFGHIDCPLDPILTGCGGMLQFVLLAADCGSQHNWSSDRGIEHAAHGEGCAGFVGVQAHGAGEEDRRAPGFANADRPPNATGVFSRSPRKFGVDKCPHQRCSSSGALVGSTSHIYGQQVITAVFEVLGDVETVGNEITVGGADVATVEPDITLLTDTVEP